MIKGMEMAFIFIRMETFMMVNSTETLSMALENSS